jgi:hypothetical protein
MINNKHLCDGNNISVYSKPSSDKTMDEPRKQANKQTTGCMNIDLFVHRSKLLEASVDFFNRKKGASYHV